METVTEGGKMLGLLPRLALSVVILAGCAGIGPSHAANALPQPVGEIVLTVSGAITVRNDGDSAVFDMAMLEALPQAEIKTETPWTEGMTTFTGFKLADLLALLGTASTNLRAFALNDSEARSEERSVGKEGD